MSHDRWTVACFVALTTLPALGETIVRALSGGPPDSVASSLDGFALRAATRIYQPWRSDRPVSHPIFRGEILVQSGTDGWRYYNATGNFDVFRGVRPFSTEAAERWKHVLQERHVWLASLGINYLPLVVPNKEAIHPEHLPKEVREQRGRSQLDQWFELVPTGSVRPLDLRISLTSEAARRHVYWPDDTHWNHHGAYVAYAATINWLGRFRPSLTPLSLEEFVERQVLLTGDLARAGGETVQGIPRIVLERRGGWRSRTDPFRLPTGYSEPRYGDTWQEPRMHSCATGKGTLLLLGDSFTQQERHFFISAMAEHFLRTVVINNSTETAPSFESIELLVRDVRPDIVIESRVERSLETPFLARLESETEKRTDATNAGKPEPP